MQRKQFQVRYQKLDEYPLVAVVLNAVVQKLPVVGALAVLLAPVGPRLPDPFCCLAHPATALLRIGHGTT